MFVKLPSLVALLLSSFALAANPAHFKGNVTIQGPWTLNPDVVPRLYKVRLNTGEELKSFNLPIARFGTFQILLPDGTGKLQPVMEQGGKRPNLIRELHYKICPEGEILRGFGEGSKDCKMINVGLRPIPIVDGFYEGHEGGKKVELSSQDGKVHKVVSGSKEMDEYLRRIWGYEDVTKGPIYAMIGYIHPELSMAPFTQLASSEHLKTENGMTHYGIFIGRGETRNSPVQYHDWTWHVSRYPANVYSVLYQGAKSQKVLNENLQIALRVLNEMNGGPVFPNDYKFDHFRTVNLSETLAFYRAWIDPTWVRYGDDKPFLSILQGDDKSSDTWATYCAEHGTIALNVGLNLEQNLHGYKEVWPETLTDKDGVITDQKGVDGKPLTVGEDLWNKVQKKWLEDRTYGGEEKVIGAGTALKGIPEGEFTPLWKLLNLKNPDQVKAIGKSLAWSPEESVDLIRDFVEQYANWGIVGPVWSSAAIMGFSREMKKRLGLGPEAFTEKAVPVLAKMFQYHMAYSISKVISPETAGWNEAELNDEQKKVLEGVQKLVAYEKDIKAAADQAAQDGRDAVKALAKTITEHENVVALLKQESANVRKGLELKSGRIWTDEERAGKEAVIFAQLKQQMLNEWASRAKLDAVARLTQDQVRSQGVQLLPNYEQLKGVYAMILGKYSAGLDQVLAPMKALLTAKAADARRVESGLERDVAPALDTKEADQYIEFVKQGILGGLSDSETQALIIANAAQYSVNRSLEKRMTWVRDQYKREIENSIELARGQAPEVSLEEQIANQAKQVQYYSPPAVLLRVVGGIHDADQRVRLVSVATAMSAQELVPMDEGVYRLECDPYQSSFEPFKDICEPVSSKVASQKDWEKLGSVKGKKFQYVDHEEAQQTGVGVKMVSGEGR